MCSLEILCCSRVLSCFHLFLLWFVILTSFLFLPFFFAFAGIGSESHHNRLLYAWNDRLWLAKENQGTNFFSLHPSASLSFPGKFWSANNWGNLQIDFLYGFHIPKLILAGKSCVLLAATCLGISMINFQRVFVQSIAGPVILLMLISFKICTFLSLVNSACTFCGWFLFILSAPEDNLVELWF